MGLRVAVLLAAFATGAVVGCNGSEAKKATVVEPVFGDPCRYDPCTQDGLCMPAQAGGPMCMCNAGYAGTTCDRCEADFHRDANNHCVPNKSCADQNPNPCAPHGSCDDSVGVIACRCDTGYDGPRCTLCASGYGHDAYGDCLQVVLGGGFRESDAGAGLDAGPNLDAGPTNAACSALACNGRGSCASPNGKAECSCNVGYASTHCEACATGYHRDALQQCALDQACMDQTCGGDHGACTASAGVTSCVCAPGYAGASCASCASGFTANGNACIADQQCSSTTCDGHGSCAASAGQTVCSCNAAYSSAHCDSCNSGYHADSTGACAVNQACSSGVCGANGDCVDTTGVTTCACHTGYSGSACASCAAGFHLQGSACVVDQKCLSTSCSSHATCDDSSGTVQCACDSGYQGTACGGCMPGYYLDYGTKSCSVFDCKNNPVSAPGVVTFDDIPGYATTNNSCVETDAQTVGPVTVTSINGDGVVWACAPASWVQMTTNHVMLEAGTQGSAKIQFAGPISTLSFEYGADTALSLQFLADGQSVGALKAPLMTSGSQSFTFSTPISVFELLSVGAFTNTIAIDDIAYGPPPCP